MVELDKVTVSFRPHFVLRDLSLKVAQGSSLALWGPNGAGKSTTFHAILDLVPYSGKITVAGKDAHKEGAAVRRLIGWAPQDLAPTDLSVQRTVKFMAQVREAQVPSIPDFLARVGLEGLASTAVASLSGGQRKRLSLALALLGDPPVLMLDEPTANLDPAGRQDLLRLLEGLRRQGKTLIMTSHRQADISRLADQVAVLEDGALMRMTTASGMAPRIARVRRPLREGAVRCACE